MIVVVVTNSLIVGTNFHFPRYSLVGSEIIEFSYDIFLTSNATTSHAKYAYNNELYYPVSRGTHRN